MNQYQLKCIQLADISELKQTQGDITAYITRAETLENNLEALLPSSMLSNRPALTRVCELSLNGGYVITMSLVKQCTSLNWFRQVKGLRHVLVSHVFWVLKCQLIAAFHDCILEMFIAPTVQVQCTTLKETAVIYFVKAKWESKQEDKM